MKKTAIPCLHAALFLSSCAILLVRSGYPQATYSYLDENGIRVLTNIAPTKPVTDLKISGLPPVPKPVATRGEQAGKSSGKSRQTPVRNPRNADSPSPLPDPVRNIGVGDADNSAARTVPAPGGDLSRIIDKYASEYQLDPILVQSVIAAESGFQRKAVSPKGALGLMQLMPGTAARLGVKDPFDPEQNIRGGAKHLRFLMDTFDNKLDLSLAAYNAGENLVLRLGRVPNIPETRDYVRMITARYGQTYMSQPANLEPAAPAYPPVFRYLDRNGVLVLTNIPPTGAGRGYYPNSSGQANSPQ